MDEIVSDELILEGVRSGDKSACDLCIIKYRPRLYRLALSLLHDADDAEDVVQESFLNAFNAIDAFRGQSGLGTWLYRITYNNALMRLRKQPPDSESVDQTLDLGEEGFVVPRQFFDWCCLPEEDFQSAEVRQELVKAIGGLSPNLSSTFILRDMEGLSTRETAVALDTSEDVVKTRLRRARLQLREALSTYIETDH
jgi:RNA polymerase sigma-70 factor (ECF subfamily)